MSCPTCAHTMQCIYDDDNNGIGVFWCPRCGTSSIQGQGIDEHFVPKLVERCREFEKTVANEFPKLIGVDWRVLGIAESINTPDQRPT